MLQNSVFFFTISYNPIYFQAVASFRSKLVFVALCKLFWLDKTISRHWKWNAKNFKKTRQKIVTKKKQINTKCEELQNKANNDLKNNFFIKKILVEKENEKKLWYWIGIYLWIEKNYNKTIESNALMLLKKLEKHIQNYGM